MNADGDFDTPEVPGDFVVFSQLVIASVERRLGYFGDDPLVIVGYCAGGDEVIWKDGHRSGFGTGGWNVFLNEISPLALRCGINLGSMGAAGTHVLLIDRLQRVVYAAPRESAECFLCHRYALSPPRQHCLCDCAARSALTCDHAQCPCNPDATQDRH